MRCILCGNIEFQLFCKSNDDRVTGRPEFFEVIQCVKCSFMMLKNPPAEDEIGGYYPDTYYAYGALGEEGASKQSLKKFLFRKTIDHFFGYGQKVWWWPLLYPFKFRKCFLPKKNEKEGKFLDIGCGSGSIMRQVKQLGWDVYGVDLSEKAIREAQASGLINTQFSPTETLSFENDFFDVVFLSHSLEHVLHLEETMKEIQRVLKPGGELIVIVPSMNSLNSKLFGKFSPAVDIPRHIYYFTPRNIKRLFENYRFETKTLVTIDLFYGLAFALYYSLGGKDINKVRWPHPIEHLITVINFFCDPIFNRLGLGAQIIVKGKKM